MELDHIEKQVSEIDDKVTLMLQLMQGNPLDKDDKGFLGEVSELHKRVSDLEQFQRKGLYVVLITALPTAYGIISLIAQFIKQIKG